MKVAIFFALVALASAGQIYNGPGVGGVIGGGLVGGYANTGSSSSSRSEDGLGNYQFAYNEQGATGGSARSESGDVYGRKSGSYALNVGDGRQRTVNYVADEHGYRAQIQTNEPGTAPLAGADTTITAPDSVGIAAATNQRTAEQLHALANAPPAIEQQIISAPVHHAVHQPQIIQQAPLLAAPAPVAVAQPHVFQQATPILRSAYAAPALRAPVSYANSIAHVAAPAIASSIYGAPAFGAYGAGLGAYGHGLSHGIAAPALSLGYQAHAQPLIQSFAQPIAQPIVQKAFLAAPRPTSYSSVVSHDAAVHHAPQLVQAAPQFVQAAPQIVHHAPQIVHHAPQIVHHAPQQILQAQPIVQQRVALPAAPALAFNPLPAYRAAAVSGVKGGWN